MNYDWREVSKQYFEDYYVHRPQEWFDWHFVPGNTVDITIVSERFIDTTLQQRREQIEEILQQFNAPVTIGFLSLYTVREALDQHLERPSKNGTEPAYNWLDLAFQAVNPSEVAQPQHESRLPRTIAFYSFKGGVGRTTALTHVATILAMRGLTVVAVDLDLEAPGLGKAFNLTPAPEYGIVDYFYERSYMPEEAGIEPTIAVSQLFSEVPIPNASGQLFVVPAGKLDLEYITKVDDLRTSTTLRGKDLWTLFFEDIKEQLQPDVILVDSRTGINEWGAFSLLRAADRAIIFLFPNDQNRQGIEVLMQVLSNRVPASFVFSPVPTIGGIGQKVVQQQWEAMYPIIHKGPVTPTSKLPEPIIIPYMTEIALASSYPVRELLAFYTPIADLVDVYTSAVRISKILADTKRRQEILKSLHIEDFDATAKHSDISLFERTASFDKLLNERIVLIRGQKGTGKSTLYNMFLLHKAVVDKWTARKANDVICISGHGPFHPSLSAEDFHRIDQAIQGDDVTWEMVWRTHLLLKLYAEGYVQRQLGEDLSQLGDVLRGVFDTTTKKESQWQASHTDALIHIATDPVLYGLVQEAMLIINGQRHPIWVFYDDIEETLKGDSELLNRILSGLLQFIEASIRYLPSIKIKLFLQENTWQSLEYKNKNYFNGRDLVLQWTKTDFLRFVLRRIRKSEHFRSLLGELAAIDNIDDSDEEQLERALQPLWGSQKSSPSLLSTVTDWLYPYLSDITWTTFPHAIVLFLNEAIQVEQQKNEDQSPKDCLLSPESLDQGLMKASRDRFENLCQDYPELRSFFDAVVRSYGNITLKDLRILWQTHVQNSTPQFKGFSFFFTFLQSIGFIDTLPMQENERYDIGPIYCYAFSTAGAIIEKLEQE